MLDRIDQVGKCFSKVLYSTLTLRSSTLSVLSIIRERQEEQGKEEEAKEKEVSSFSKSTSSGDWAEWKSEHACGRMLEEGPSQVIAL